MNTTPHTFNTIANKLKRENVLRSPVRYHYPSWAKHGDACIDIGHIGTPLQLRAKNHDPQHEVYGVSLQFSQVSRDAKRSQDLPAQPEKEAQIAHATEQRCLADADTAVVASGSQDPPAQREHETQVPILETKQQELRISLLMHSRMTSRSTTPIQKQSSKQYSWINHAGHPRHFSKSTMSSELSFSSFQTALKIKPHGRRATPERLLNNGKKLLHVEHTLIRLDQHTINTSLQSK